MDDDFTTDNARNLGSEAAQSTSDSSQGEVQVSQTSESSEILDSLAETQASSPSQEIDKPLTNAEDWAYAEETPIQEQTRVTKNIKKYKSVLEVNLKELEDLKLMCVEFDLNQSYYKSWSRDANFCFRKTVLLNLRMERIALLKNPK